MDTSENSVAHRNFVALADAVRSLRETDSETNTRLQRLEQVVAQQDALIVELRTAVYMTRGHGATA